MNPIVYTALLASALSSQPTTQDLAAPHSRPSDVGPRARPRETPMPMPSPSRLLAAKKPIVSYWTGRNVFGLSE